MKLSFGICLFLTLIIISTAAAGFLDRIRQCNNIKDSCRFCQELRENNIDTAHTWTFKGDMGKEQKKLPISNLHLAMEGYDIFAGHYFSNPDPGRRSQIFEPLRTENGETFVNSFIEDITSDIDCDGKMQTYSLINLLDDYKETNIHGFKLLLENFSRDQSMISELSFPFDYSNKDKNKTFIGEIHCVTNSINISPFDKPVFTTRFASALKILNEAAQRPTSLRSKDTAITFFKTYGTHFSKSSQLGAKVIFESKFSDKVLTVEEKLKRMECMTESSKKSLQDGKGNIELTQSKYASSIAKCDKKRMGSKDVEGNKIIAIGPLPKQSLNTWSTDTIENPVPVSFELIKISHLFHQTWLDSTLKKGEEKLNGDQMYKFLEYQLVDYCKAVLGKRCRMTKYENPTINSLYNDQSGQEILAAKVEEILPKFKRSQLNGTRGIIIQGGYDSGITTMKSAEVISTALIVELPDTPEGMGGHSLATVGSRLYSCGTCTPWNIQAVQRKCYELDMLNGTADWVSSTQLPAGINNFHSAVTIGNFIWYFTLNSSSVYIFDPKLSNFEENVLPFTYHSNGCFASNLDGVYYIDTDDSIIYSLEDETKSEDWSLYNVKGIGNYFRPSCLLIGEDLIVTGGNGSQQNENFQSINVETFVAKNISNFNEDRVGYSLFVLDGRPAVAGGVYKRVLDSIETYNFVTDEWKILSKLRSARAYYGLTQYSY